MNFDSDLSESRYYVVSSIFDQTITFRHKELTQAAKAINDAAAKLAGKNNPQAMKLLDDARDAAYSPVVTEQKSKDKEFLALYRNTKRDAEKPSRPRRSRNTGATPRAKTTSAPSNSRTRPRRWRNKRPHGKWVPIAIA